ncbi:MAG: DUF6445 family protein [Pseudomonadota bacterium]
MTPALHRFGESQSPVVTLDGFSGDPAAIVELAAALAPFPADHGTYYPGCRRIVTEADTAAYAYVEHMLEAAAPFIGGGFGFERFELIEASFSMVTALPAKLSLPQRVPHFDSTDPDYVALLHYLSDTPGTAFYRQRLTGIETVTARNMDSFIHTAKRESATLIGYTSASNQHFEQIGRIAGTADRLAIYQGCLLHSGVIPEGMTFSDDPRRGRLTANIFIKGHRS